MSQIDYSQNTALYVNHEFFPIDVNGDFATIRQNDAIENMINSQFKKIYISIGINRNGDIICNFMMGEGYYTKMLEEVRRTIYDKCVIHDGTMVKKNEEHFISGLAKLYFSGKKIAFSIWTCSPLESWLSLFLEGSDSVIRKNFVCLRKETTLQIPDLTSTETITEYVQNTFHFEPTESQTDFIKEHKGKTINLIDQIDFANDDLHAEYFFSPSRKGGLSKRNSTLYNFAVMLHEIGFKHISYFASWHEDWWIYLTKQLQAKYPGFVKEINLRCYQYSDQTSPGKWLQLIDKFINQPINASKIGESSGVEPIVLDGFVIPNLLAVDEQVSIGKDKLFTPAEMFFQFMTFKYNDPNYDPYLGYITGGSTYTYEFIVNSGYLLNEYHSAIVSGLSGG